MMNIILVPFLQLLTGAINLYIFILLTAVVMSWLINFNILNYSNKLVATIAYFCDRLTEPVLQPIRRLMPDLGGIDISPIILILLLNFLENVFHQLIINFITV